MKKLIVVLCVIFSLACFTAFAEGADNSNTILLWEHTFIYENENNGEPVEQTVQVTLTTAEPVTMSVVQNEVSDGFIGIVSRPGFAPVSIDIYPAEYKPHANLKNATDDERQILIDYMTEQFAEGQYTVEDTVLEDGSVYIGVGDNTIRSVMTVIEDVEMELIQAHFEEHFKPLEQKDHEFATEILKGITIK